MKKIIITIAAFIFIGISCQDSNENPVQERGEHVVPTMSEPAPAYFTDNIDESYVQFDLSLTAGQTVDKVSIEVVGSSKRAILRDVTLPVTGLKVTASEVLSALGISPSDYKSGDSFELYVLTTKNGITTRSIAAFTINVVCYFEPSMLIGDFYYVSEEWEEEGMLTFEADPDDPYTVYVYGMPETQGLEDTGNPIILTVNPNNFSVSGPKVIISPKIWGYSNNAYEPIFGSYSACDNQFKITFQISVDDGLWGNFLFVFSKE